MLYEAQKLYAADELLGNNVTEDILDKATKWLYHLASTLDVAEEDIKPSFLVQELITAYAFREVCIAKSFALPNAWSGNDGDYYSKKLKYYEDRIKQLEGKITPADFTGDKKGSKGYRAVSIMRG